MFRTPKLVPATLAVIAAGALAPAAEARFDLNPPRTPQPAPIVATSSASGSSDFSWGDAGLGAAGMLALFGVAGASAVVVRQRRRPQRSA